MASRPKITGRITSIAGAFVHAIIPRRVDKIAQSALYERFGIDPTKCVYCGRDKTDDDHFRAIVKAGKPSGYFHTVDNIVPSCGPCNQSKGGADWKTWMKGAAKGSPTRRGITDTAARIERLSKFAEGANSVCPSEEDLQLAVGADLWRSYWNRLETIKAQLAEAQGEAEKISAILQREFDSRWQKNPSQHMVPT